MHRLALKTQKAHGKHMFATCRPRFWCKQYTEHGQLQPKSTCTGGAHGLLRAAPNCRYKSCAKFKAFGHIRSDVVIVDPLCCNGASCFPPPSNNNGTVYRNFQQCHICVHAPPFSCYRGLVRFYSTRIGLQWLTVNDRKLCEKLGPQTRNACELNLNWPITMKR